MKKLLIIIIIIMLVASMPSLYAQSRNSQYIDLSVAASGGFSPALSYNYLWGIGKKGEFRIGTGARLTYFASGSRDFITAPARLTSGQTGPQVLFVENITANLDTLHLNKASVFYLNIPIHLQYSFSQKFDIGFNIDAIGLSFGSRQSGKFYASNSQTLNGSTQSAKPTVFNLLLVSDNDLGSLNSELYARYWLNNRTAIRLGASFQFIEYTTNRLLTLENDRFRSKNLMPMVAVSFKF